VPAALGGLEFLDTLKLSGNKLTSVPEELSNTRLKWQGGD